jgi:pre-60S factor REI1
MEATAGSEEAGHRCQSCGLEFRDEGLIREHYKSDLHLYNLRRRSAGLAPVDMALFARKQAAAAAAVAARTAEETAAPTIFACPYSRKVFKSKAQFDQYQRSKKYLQLKAKAETETAKAAEADAAAAESGAGGSEAAVSAEASADGSKAASADEESSEAGAASASASSARKEPEWDTMTVFTHCMFDNSPIDGLAA